MLLRLTGRFLPFLIAGIILCTGIWWWVNSSSEIKLLVRQLESGDVESQIAAIEKLQSAGTKRAVDALENAVSDPSEDVRTAALAALAGIGSDQAVRALTSALASRNQAVRLDAAEALARLDSEEAREALATYEESAQNSYERASTARLTDAFRRQKRREDAKNYRRYKKTHNVWGR